MALNPFMGPETMARSAIRFSYTDDLVETFVEMLGNRSSSCTGSWSTPAWP